ncbi:sensor histidine kinase [Sinomicrobium soli]|uniref:sensor histidine kinase n=1 Tax=Sinomicrobium sp. N-1-3-6 TaxID=2219864 RepID=UPI000DCEACFD|nr:HAMP domain-containing sensor histidine kinase [Sinomicrobium sp. N-1-3-6]RAV29118.1 two-component sensor histidine kinase [Sinomicrobium sp. N-1-3-6]
MSKKLFVLLVALMSLSLIGIIFVQGYWIKTAVDDKEEQFSTSIVQILRSVADKIERREIEDYSNRYLQLVDSIGKFKEAELRQILFIDRNEENNETFIYSHGVLEEDYGISSTFFDSESDSIPIKNFNSKRSTIIYEEGIDIDGKKTYTPSERIEKIGGMTAIDKAQFETYFQHYAKRKPISERVSDQEIQLLLQRELSEAGIDLDFEYGVYGNDLATKVRSRGFELSESTRYKVPIFLDEEGKTDFALLVTFPQKKKFLVSSIMGMALLSIIFTLIIVIAYSGAIHQLLRQKQISEIKTDFINNMTHEFKTPIATINLALDAIRNPKVLENNDKVSQYLQMIRDENKRMHAQVENVLRISKLEKNQLEISKNNVDIHDIIEEAIAHVSLMVENRGGEIRTDFKADRSEVLANEFHFTNVLVNILDNAIKYSPDSPRIDVHTETVKNNIVIRIQDQGMGMSKAVLKRIFEKFYREHTGNIHNVKGHGLGLAYVKNVVEDHQGMVYVESEKDKGSTFFIKLPLI